MRISLRGGLPVPVAGEAVRGETEDAKVERVSLLGTDYPGMRARVLVSEGETVKVGTPLFYDRGSSGITVTAPVSGTIEQVVIGAKRRLSNVVIRTEGAESVTFKVEGTETAEGLRALMLEAGMWPALRARPFDRIPSPDSAATAIFVTATDTRPLAPNPLHVLAGQEEAFARGVAALKHLTEGRIYVCQGPGAPLVDEDAQIVLATFTGLHPAGLPGTHIARLHPASRQTPVWHIGYQDVAALGALLNTGQITGQRTITLAGPGTAAARQMRVPMGADLHALARQELTPGQKRILSGSALGGRESQYLSRYHVQATVLNRPPVKQRNWLVAALRQAAAPAAFVPTQAVERALGPDMHVVPLLRALSIGDADTAERLGCLQLAEEDMALATYATGGEIDFGARLRAVLDSLEAA